MIDTYRGGSDGAWVVLIEPDNDKFVNVLHRAWRNERILFRKEPREDNQDEALAGA